jgi:hypothetical protein
MPGPGSYDIKKIYDARDYNVAENQTTKFSFPKGAPYQPKNDTPGPGTYKLPVGLASVPKYSMPN